MARPVPISVVLLWREPREDLSACLCSVLEQVIAVGGEVLIVVPRGEIERRPGNNSVPMIRWVGIDRPFTEPRAWEAGALAAQGARVAFGQARCRYVPGWVEAAVGAEIDSGSVAAGPVSQAGGSLAELAAYVCDYGIFADPAGQGGGRAASNNVVFDRLSLLRQARGQGLDKTQLLAQGDFRVCWVPAMTVTVCRPSSFWSAAGARFHRGRHYAAQRAERWSRLLRWAAGCAGAGLPALLLGRLVANRYLRRHFAGTLVFGLPWLLVLLVTWSLGEMAGYWTGAGSSASYV